MQKLYAYPPSGRTWPFWLVIAILLCLLVGAFWMNGISSGGRAAASIATRSAGGTDEFPVFAETHSYGSGTTKVVRITFNGILSRNVETGFFTSTHPLRSAIRQIRAARQDAKVAAILFEVDSPGGELTAADELYDELRRFRQSRADRRVVVLVHGMAASGGYYISLPADQIIAQPTSILGSIGVILQSYNVKELGERLGIRDTTIKSGEHKDLLNPFREPDPAELALLQGNIDAMHERFLRLISEHRRMPRDQVAPLADGRIFTADQALEAGLVDGIGYWPEAVQAACTLLNVDALHIVTYRSSSGFFEMLFQPLEVALRQFTAKFPATPRIDLLWQP